MTRRLRSMITTSRLTAWCLGLIIGFIIGIFYGGLFSRSGVGRLENELVRIDRKFGGQVEFAIKSLRKDPNLSELTQRLKIGDNLFERRSYDDAERLYADVLSSLNAILSRHGRERPEVVLIASYAEAKMNLARIGGHLQGLR